MDNTVIAVIGAGNIGSRHLQGLAYGMRPYEIHIVEPLEPATAVSKERMRDAIAVSCKDNMSCYWHHRIPDHLAERNRLADPREGHAGDPDDSGRS